MKVNALNLYLAKLIDIGLVVSFNAITDKKLQGNKIEIEVGDTSQTADFNLAHEGSIQHYIDIVNSSQYSALLFDGSLLQLKYRIKSRTIIWHRFVFIPGLAEQNLDNPFHEFDFGGNPILEPRKTCLRFEYDPEEKAPNHPASHLHLNSGNCRIPINTRLGVKKYIWILCELFYPEFLPELEDERLGRNFNDNSATDKLRPNILIPQNNS
ncbi:MAG: DUF2290 domain-containing protein [Maricaulaceae bacterium]